MYFPESNFCKDAGKIPKLRMGFQSYGGVSGGCEFKSILEMEQTCSSLQLLDSRMPLCLWRSSGGVGVYPVSIRRGSQRVLHH